MKRTKLFKSLLVAVLLCVGASAWAVTVTETYDFGGFITANGAPGMSLGSTVVATQNGTSEFTGGDLYQLDNPVNNGQALELNNRFAIDYGASAGVQIRFMWRSSTNAYQHGLAGNWNGKGTANTACHLSVLDLKVGDKITFTYAIQPGKTAQPYLCKSGVVTGVDADAYLASGTEYTIATAGNLDIYFKNNNFAVSKIVIVTEKEGDETMGAPSIDVSAVDGNNRTITITPGVGNGGSAATATYYTLDGTSPSATNGTSYTAPFVISSTTTIKAVSYLNETVGEIAEKEIEAGTAITLNAPTISVSGVEANGEYFNPIFTATSNQNTVLLKPTATITATFNGTEVNLPYTVTEKGTLAVTASADGYASAVTTMTVYANYVQQWQSADFSSLSDVEAIEAAMGGTWTLSSDHGRWASWNKDKDGTYNFYSASTNGTYNERVNFRNVVVLAEGMGLGRNVTGGEAIAITNTAADDIVALEVYNGFGNDINKGTNTYMSYVLSNGTDNPTLNSTNSALLVQATVYAPLKYSSMSIVGDFSEGGFEDLTKGIAMTRDANNPYVWTAVVEDYVVTSSKYNYNYKAVADQDYSVYELPSGYNNYQNYNFDYDGAREGKYTLTFTVNTKNHSVELAIEKQKTATLFFVDTNNWGADNIKVYAWNDSWNNGWPGEGVTATGETVDEKAVYSWTSYALNVPTMIIISNNGDSNERTGDQPFVNGATYKADGSSTVTKTITAAGYATFCCSRALDFSTSGLTAYIAKKGEDNKVTFSPVTKVPANTGVLLKGDAGEYTISSTWSETDDITGNVLKGVNVDTKVPAGSFVLLNGAEGVGFYKTTKEFTVGANTAYIEALSTARFIGFDSEESTGIEGVAAEQQFNGQVYDLQGRRVTELKHGLYIVNGRKVVVK